MIIKVLGLICMVLYVAMEIHAEIRKNEFEVLQSKTVTNVDMIVSSRSRVRCADSCLKIGNCISATYNSSNKECLISADGFMNIMNIADDNVTTILVKGVSTANGNQFGKSFFTGYTCNGKSCLGTPSLIMVSASPGPTNVLITIPYLNIYLEHHVLDGFLYLQYDVSLTSNMASNYTSKGIEIVSDQPMALYSLNHRSLSADGTLELPKEKWGTLYIISTHDSFMYGTGQILVVAAENNTNIHVEFPSGSNLVIDLDKYETYQFQANEMEPIAGTLVSANKPIIVHAGHMCANIPDHNTVFCDFIMENMPPVNTLGSVFVVPYQRTRSMYTMGIVAPFDATTVNIKDISGNILETFAMNRQDSTFRNYNESEILSITSSQNILVTQYGHGSSNIYGDPSLTIVPAITQFINRCNFEVPPIFTDPSVVSIIIDSFFDMQGLQMNGSPIVPAESASVLIPGIGTFDVIYINVTSNVAYSLHHNDVNVRFGAILYARDGESEFTTILGYGL